MKHKFEAWDLLGTKNSNFDPKEEFDKLDAEEKLRLTKIAKEWMESLEGEPET
jgi:hypothetical protein